MEPKVKSKIRFFNTYRPALDSFEHLDLTMSLQVGSSRMSESSLMGCRTALHMTIILLKFFEKYVEQELDSFYVNIYKI